MSNSPNNPRRSSLGQEIWSKLKKTFSPGSQNENSQRSPNLYETARSSNRHDETSKFYQTAASHSPKSGTGSPNRSHYVTANMKQNNTINSSAEEFGTPIGRSPQPNDSDIFYDARGSPQPPKNDTTGHYRTALQSPAQRTNNSTNDRTGSFATPNYNEQTTAIARQSPNKTAQYHSARSSPATYNRTNTDNTINSIDFKPAHASSPEPAKQESRRPKDTTIKDIRKKLSFDDDDDDDYHIGNLYPTPKRDQTLKKKNANLDETKDYGMRQLYKTPKPARRKNDYLDETKDIGMAQLYKTPKPARRKNDYLDETKDIGMAQLYKTPKPAGRKNDYLDETEDIGMAQLYKTPKPARNKNDRLDETKDYGMAKLYKTPKAARNKNDNLDEAEDYGMTKLYKTPKPARNKNDNLDETEDYGMTKLYKTPKPARNKNDTLDETEDYGMTKLYKTPKSARNKNDNLDETEDYGMAKLYKTPKSARNKNDNLDKTEDYGMRQLYKTPKSARRKNDYLDETEDIGMAQLYKTPKPARNKNDYLDETEDYGMTKLYKTPKSARRKNDNLDETEDYNIKGLYKTPDQKTKKKHSFDDSDYGISKLYASPAHDQNVRQKPSFNDDDDYNLGSLYRTPKRDQTLDQTEDYHIKGLYKTPIRELNVRKKLSFDDDEDYNIARLYKTPEHDKAMKRGNRISVSDYNLAQLYKTPESKQKQRRESLEETELRNIDLTSANLHNLQRKTNSLEDGEDYGLARMYASPEKNKTMKGAPVTSKRDKYKHNIDDDEDYYIGRLYPTPTKYKSVKQPRQGMDEDKSYHIANLYPSPKHDRSVRQQRHHLDDDEDTHMARLYPTPKKDIAVKQRRQSFDEDESYHIANLYRTPNRINERTRSNVFYENEDYQTDNVRRTQPTRKKKPYNLDDADLYPSPRLNQRLRNYDDDSDEEDDRRAKRNKNKRYRNVGKNQDYDIPEYFRPKMASLPKSQRWKSQEELVECPYREFCPQKCEYCSCYMESRKRICVKEKLIDPKPTSQGKSNTQECPCVKINVRKCQSNYIRCRDHFKERQDYCDDDDKAVYNTERCFVPSPRGVTGYYGRKFRDNFCSCCNRDFESECPQSSGKEYCSRCRRKVYAMERMQAAGGVFHDCCFTCCVCRRSLDSLNLLSRKGEVYCKQCYMKHFGPHIYGYGMPPNLLS